MHICVLVFLRPNLNYIYCLCPIIYINSTCSDVKSFLYCNIINTFYLFWILYSRLTAYHILNLQLIEPYVIVLFNSLVVLSPLLIFYMQYTISTPFSQEILKYEHIKKFFPCVQYFTQISWSPSSAVWAKRADNFRISLQRICFKNIGRFWMFSI
jgi:hypothetical protein